jgi:hypothetical protein
MDRFHDRVDVYSDAYAAGNHFNARAQMSSPNDEDAVPAMNESAEVDPHSGLTCIEATFKAKGSNWGGWYFMNGVLEGTEKAPRLNWGDLPDSGVDLRGATALEWWARGRDGGERVEFFAFGVGRDPQTGEQRMPFPDSSVKQVHKPATVTLSREWTRYEIVLAPDQDLKYVLGGFGWTANSPANGNKDITFFIDDIRYNKSTLDKLRFLVSYETINSNVEFDRMSRNVAYTYDNALALLAFLAAGERDRARLIAEALIYAQGHDPFKGDGRLRNAYQGGDLVSPPGWHPNGTVDSVRLPGWIDPTTRDWREDERQVGSNTGNLAWAMLALLAYSEAAHDRPALAAAERLGDWIEAKCRDTRGRGGYKAGFEGFEPKVTTLEYKATEHNIDLYAAFRRLYRLTSDSRWRDRAAHAKQFVLSMWEDTEGKFWTGTENDGIKPVTNVIPLDVQAWAVLALKDEGEKTSRTIKYAESQMLRPGEGFSFKQGKDGVWYEGTAQMVAAYRAVDQNDRASAVIKILESAQLPSGALDAADRDGLPTGFLFPGAKPWLIYRRPHVGATAWYVLATLGINPLAE